ncbi:MULTISPECIES: disulfide bond formation protein B [Pseudomonas]|uniref:Disulfide bond formation protein B n=1 Tax=Pseudomonas luteola TaxID=47886 RepID=A0ABS0FNZ9_PSELU|nr:MULTISPECIES: disulfide bond formation protein B [Pseudomonas]MBA1248973.1 disulfide bond formation protein B [Pseudomonas zeshuii]MBF8642044.1 disulfide bond formation protein B [Pseudomonas zeshuii]MBW5412747.1 disulfide bond formation protein B [Pseudomonas sp. MAG002Y]MCG7373179.1 disulfide bond formation protein B [Pseudomonas luteola]QEU31405.1 disulfide bond formation protein B [Pseudomonas luteola]
MLVTSPRFIFSLIAIACAVLMAAGLYLEHVLGLEPCPLCIVQRIFFIIAGILAFIAALHNPATRGQRVYAVLIFLSSALGAATAGRQVWLQTLPADQLPACLPSLDYMMQALPFQDVVRLVLHGTADCAEVNWTLFGMSVPEWSLLAFTGFILLSIYQFFRRSRGVIVR